METLGSASSSTCPYPLLEQKARKMSGVALGKEKAKADLLDVTAPMRSRLLGSLRESLKSSCLEDPDMWPSVRSGFASALDRIWADFEHEIERNLHFALLQHQADADAVGPSAKWFLPRFLLRVRAFVLHHYLPNDKYIFGKLKDPIYLLIYMLTLIPVHGVRVIVFSLILLMLIFPGPPDEFQLINFILLFKGSQFLTSGVVAMGLGATKYYVCYSLHKDDLLECINTNGPASSQALGQATDYLGSVALVWVAFFLLPYSKKYTLGSIVSAGIITESEDKEEARRAGGRLRRLLHYDIRCFGVSLLVLGMLTACFSDVELDGKFISHPQFCQNLYWCCVLYSLLALPFASFLIPCWQTVLTHSDPTGYNEHGACVGFGLNPVGKTVDDLEPPPEEGWTRYARMATTVLRVMHLGREARGSTEETDYEFWDIGRGVWSQLRGNTGVSDAASPDLANVPVEKNELHRGDTGTWSTSKAYVRSIAAMGPELLASGVAGVTGGESSKSADFGRAFWNYMQNGAGGREDDPIFAVVDVQMPPDAIEERDGVLCFCIDAMAFGSLAEENDICLPRVFRCGADFSALARRLGPQSGGYADAAFPWNCQSSCFGSDLEEIRVSLERWLRRVLQDPEVQGAWGKYLCEFFQPGDFSPPDPGVMMPPDPGAMMPRMYAVHEDVAWASDTVSSSSHAEGLILDSSTAPMPRSEIFFEAGVSYQALPSEAVASDGEFASDQSSYTVYADGIVDRIPEDLSLGDVVDNVYRRFSVARDRSIAVLRRPSKLSCEVIVEALPPEDKDDISEHASLEPEDGLESGMPTAQVLVDGPVAEQRSIISDNWGHGAELVDGPAAEHRPIISDNWGHGAEMVDGPAAEHQPIISDNWGHGAELVDGLAAEHRPIISDNWGHGAELVNGPAAEHQPIISDIWGHGADVIPPPPLSRAASKIIDSSIPEDLSIGDVVGGVFKTFATAGQRLAAARESAVESGGGFWTKFRAARSSGAQQSSGCIDDDVESARFPGSVEPIGTPSVSSTSVPAGEHVEPMDTPSVSSASIPAEAHAEPMNTLTSISVEPLQASTPACLQTSGTFESAPPPQQKQDPMMVGCLAQVHGLQGAIELNGSVVVPLMFDETRERWLVRMVSGDDDNGSGGGEPIEKWIKPANLRLAGVAARE